MEMMDTFGVPEYFVTHIGSVEYADGGNIRIVRCIKRNGVLMPVFSMVAPTDAVIVGSVQIRDAAQRIFNFGQAQLAHH